MDAQLKTLIDRTVPRYTEIKNKEFYYIVAAADTKTANMEKTIEGLRGFTLDCLDGTVEKGIIYFNRLKRFYNNTETADKFLSNIY